MAPPAPRWWKDGTAYQIWPASYKDSNGDGYGDIPGIISTLDYLKDLGIDIIWLSPMYDSPQHDMGYDIANYEDVWPKFGTMADMDELIEKVHSRGMRLLLDLVVNHTSDEHKWFQESKKSNNNPYSDWYIWRDPKYDAEGNRQPPNNWKSFFGGSAWEYVAERDQYYLHLFAKQQPDLNWENEVTRKAVYKSAIEFWLDKGIDGFRVDVVNLYSKDVTYPDVVPGASIASQCVNGPRMHEFLQEQRRDVLEKYGDVALVGELGSTDAEEIMNYISADRRELDMIFDFGILEVGGRFEVEPHETWKHKLPEFKEGILKVQNFLKRSDAWATVFAENHDQGRSLSRYATDEPKSREKAAKMMAILLGTLSGTLFLYQGQEIGMVNVPKDWGPEYLRDIAAVNYYKSMNERYTGDEKILQSAISGLQRVGRDNARTPVQWSAEKYAGFSTVEPWIRVHDNYEEVNIAAQEKDPHSVLAFWKKMLKLRKDHADVLVHGQFELFDYEDLNIFTYVKDYQGKKVLVALNFSDEEQAFAVPSSVEGRKLNLLIANFDDLRSKLSPWEARAYLVE
jgi:oligo-1,6-glucosidase